MIFAELEYPQGYRDIHSDLGTFLLAHFEKVQLGLQGDSWFHISVGGESVDVDTFSAMKHQIKSDKTGPHVSQVIETLQLKYKVNVFEEPRLEIHEDD